MALFSLAVMAAALSVSLSVCVYSAIGFNVMQIMFTQVCVHFTLRVAVSSNCHQYLHIRLIDWQQWRLGGYC